MLSSHLDKVHYFKRPYLAVPAVLAFLGPATAQSIAPDEMHARTFPYLPPSTVTLRAQVDLVEVPVVVRDGQRRAVAGLTRDDFEIYDAGKKQTITAFSVEHFTPQGDTNSGAKSAAVPSPAHVAALKGESRPRFVALCFDDLNTDMIALKPVKKAAEQFVKTALAPGDRVAVVTTAQSQDSEFTGDVPKLVEQIDKVTSHQRFTAYSAQECPPISPYEAYLIANYLDKALLRAKTDECSACQHTPCPENQVMARSQVIWERGLGNSRNTLRVVESVVDGMAKLPGQRTVLLTSSGFLAGNLEVDLERLMAKALQAEVVINTLAAKRLNAVIPAGEASQREGGFEEAKMAERTAQAGDDAMAVLASGTGGTFYHNSNGLARGFRELGMVPETMYVLGFAPSDVAADGRFHRLKVQLAAGKRYSLQARLGYTAPSAQAASSASPLSKLEGEVTASDTITDLPAWFTWEQWAGLPGIAMVAHVDVNRLRFTTNHDRRAQRLIIVAVLRDSRGSFVTGKESEVELNFTNATFVQLAKTGLTAAMTLQAPPGSYSVRAVALDALEGKLAAASATVQIK
ncbi:MAG: VWA domain-containing protein [Bryobacteraceae bacterium]|jgi:VWFA-related protein